MRIIAIAIAAAATSCSLVVEARPDAATSVPVSTLTADAALVGVLPPDAGPDARPVPDAAPPPDATPPVSILYCGGCGAGQGCYYQEETQVWECLPVGAAALGASCTEQENCAADLFCGPSIIGSSYGPPNPHFCSIVCPGPVTCSEAGFDGCSLTLDGIQTCKNAP